MKCPRCDVTLEHNNDILRRCQQCKGVYLSHEAVQTLLVHNEQLHSHKNKEADQSIFKDWLSSPQFEESQDVISCPHCKYNMYLVDSAGVTLDYCLNCEGIWFDFGELQAIRQKLESGQLQTLVPTPIGAEDHDVSLIFHMLHSLSNK